MTNESSYQLNYMKNSHEGQIKIKIIQTSETRIGKQEHDTCDTRKMECDENKYSPS